MTSSLPVNQIICSDALSVLRCLPSSSIDLMVTDPPYGDNVGYGPKNIRIAGNEHPLVALHIMAEAYRLLKKNSVAYMFCGMRHLCFLRLFFTQYTRYRIREVIIWDKVTIGVGAAFRKQYECILVLEKGRPIYQSRKLLNVLRHRRVRDSAHPHAKPPPLIKDLLLHSSQPGDIVLDPFVGTGTTAVAARATGRRYIGIDIDPRHCRRAEQRLADYEQS